MVMWWGKDQFNNNNYGNNKQFSSDEEGPFQDHADAYKRGYAQGISKIQEYLSKTNKAEDEDPP